jgi:cytochrome oxidase Cu insertion factor (SCO1/SenC/PrrC family)
VLLLLPHQAQPGTALLILASASGEALAPVRVHLGGQTVTLDGAAPRAPDQRDAATLALAPGTYQIEIDGVPGRRSLPVTAGQVEPVLLTVRAGSIAADGIYVGAGDVSLGMQELSGRLSPLAAFHLVDQDGRALDRDGLLGRDTVIAAFHTTCHETCPLYTGLMFQLRRLAPDVRLVEVTTDPGTDTPGVLAAYRSSIGADWTFATGEAAGVTEFWAPFGVSLATGDTHTSALALVDRHGFIRAAFTGSPDVGGKVPSAVLQQLDGPGRSLLAGHGDGWGAPQVLDSLRALSAAGGTAAGGAAPAFSLPALDGSRQSLEQFEGQPLIVNFWWSGCPPCRQEMPLLQRYADGHQGTRLLLVDPVDGAAAAGSFVGSIHVHAPVLIDAGGRVAAGYGVAAYPTSFFVRADGTIASRYSGALSEESLASHLSNLGGA